jgi:HD superfamily phosphohydrolase
MPDKPEMPNLLLDEMAGAVEYPIHDAVHSRVWLTPAELRIVDTHAFQRLRRVSQLGLADFVFPAATRTRFSHSVGAVYVMGELLKANKGEIANHLKSFGIDWRALRFAALLHDIGHLPFSHPMEQVYQRIEFERSGVFQPRDLPTDLLDRASGTSTAEGSTKRAISASHETLAEYVLTHDEDVREPLLEVGSDMPTLVSQLIRGQPTLTAVATALISSDLDADRLDFVLRDSHSAGLIYGLVDLDYLVENIKIAYANGLPVFAIDAKHGIGPLEHYLLARSFIYSQLVHHKTVAAAELLLRAVLLGAADLGILPQHSDGIADLFRRRQFHVLTDGSILTVLGDVAARGLHPATDEELPDEFLQLTCALMSRRLPKIAWSDVLLTHPDHAPKMRKLKEHFTDVHMKEHLADAATRAGGVSVAPRDLAFLERKETVVAAYSDPELEGKNIRPPEGALVAHGTDPPRASPLTREGSSFLAQAAGLQRIYRYVFVMDDPNAKFKTSPKADAVSKALSTLGLLTRD